MQFILSGVHPGPVSVFFFHLFLFFAQIWLHPPASLLPNSSRFLPPASSAVTARMRLTNKYPRSSWWFYNLKRSCLVRAREFYFVETVSRNLWKFFYCCFCSLGPHVPTILRASAFLRSFGAGGWGSMTRSGAWLDETSKTKILYMAYPETPKMFCLFP